MKLKHTALATAMVLILAGAHLLADPAPASQADPAAGAPGAQAAEPAPESNYQLSPGDVVLVKVFREDDLTTTARVGQDGKIAFPLIGDVHISGKTADEAARDIRGLLDARFLVDPHVTVSLVGFGKRQFTVLGQVQKPGAYNMSYHDQIDLLQAIGMAGGYTRFGDASKIIVKRRVGAENQIYTLNAARMAKGHGEEPFQVLPGDTITVSESIF